MNDENEIPETGAGAPDEPEAPETGAGAPDAPDYGEPLAAIADVLAQILASIAELRGELSQVVQVSNAAAVENGASVTDVSAAATEIVDEVFDPAARDYALD